ncbi:9474_t:CDS:2, partial [Paraglomus brasilianum]
WINIHGPAYLVSTSIMLITAACLFHAFKIAVQELKEYYEKILPLAHEHNLCNSKFPYINSYYDKWKKSNVAFTWFEQYEDKLIFFAEKEENKDTICIKFTQTYSVEAHKWCSNNGMASELNEFKECFPPSEQVKSQIMNIITTLHSQDLVHGDIHGSNILVSKDDGIMLIDFDWSGKEGEVRYNTL